MGVSAQCMRVRKVGIPESADGADIAACRKVEVAQEGLGILEGADEELAEHIELAQRQSGSPRRLGQHPALTTASGLYLQRHLYLRLCHS